MHIVRKSVISNIYSNRMAIGSSLSSKLSPGHATKKKRGIIAMTLFAILSTTIYMIGWNGLTLDLDHTLLNVDESLLTSQDEEWLAEPQSSLLSKADAPAEISIPSPTRSSVDVVASSDTDPTDEKVVEAEQQTINNSSDTAIRELDAQSTTNHMESLSKANTAEAKPKPKPNRRGIGMKKSYREVRVESGRPIGGAFIHLGKTGGSTLTRFLANSCHSFLPHPCGVIANETLVSKRITDYYHVPDFHLLPEVNHTFYLISLRDPYERTVSAFVYGHPSNAEALGIENDNWKRKQRGGYFQPICFETLEEFVKNIGDNPTDYIYPYHQREVQQKNCTNFARAMFNSRVHRMQHLFFSYVYVHSLLPQSLDKLTIYVTRKDHLHEDFGNINHILGEQQPPEAHSSGDDTHERDTSNVTMPVTRDLSDEGRQRLCRALEPEYRIYIDFLLQSDNLDGQDVIDALTHSRTRCPNLDILSESN